MLFPEEDAPVLKTWIVKRLETPSRTDSDVDADVLADYVLALLRHDGDSSSVQQLCVTELYDFLKDEAGPFVDDVFQALTYKSYRPGARPHPPPHPAQKPDSTKANLLPTAAGSGPSFGSAYATPAPPGVVSPFGYGIAGVLPADQSHGESRKRAYHDSTLFAAGSGDAPDRKNGQLGLDERSAKQARRGGSFRGGRGGPSGVPPETRTYITAAALPGAPGYPAGSAFGAPPPDEILRLQRQLGLSAPMYGGYSAPAMGQQPKSSSTKRRCRNLDRKGTCSKPNCPFDHGVFGDFTGNGSGMGADSFLQFQQASMFPLFPPMFNQLFDPQQQQQPLSQPGGYPQPTKRPRRGERSQLSTDGPVFDESKSTIVVEGIPAEFLTNEAVEQFFSQFGQIESIQVEAPKSLAVVKYASWAEANAAYQSPKVIFDNRFVKVFWHKDEAAANGQGAAADDGEPEIDMEEFQKKQEEAQRTYEEKLRKKQELDRQREELGERIKDLLAKQAKERQKLVTMMAMAAAKVKSRQGVSNGGSNGGSEDGSNGGSEDGSSGADTPTRLAALTQTDLIRAQLAALEEEARMLGLDPDAMLRGEDTGEKNTEAYSTSFDGYKAAPSTWPVRGGYAARGRGGFYRGGGRGSSFAGRGRNASVYAAYSLDNRPRRVAVAGVDFTAPGKDEALRQYLLGIGDFASIDTTEEAATITFADRRTAEQFYYSLPHARKNSSGRKPSQSMQRMIPGIDTPVEIQWVANTAGMPTSSGQHASKVNGNGNGSGSGNGNGNGAASGAGSFMINTMDDEEDGDDDDHGYQEREDGEIDESDNDDDRRQLLRQQNMDFDVAGDDGGWDIA